MNSMIDNVMIIELLNKITSVAKCEPNNYLIIRWQSSVTPILSLIPIM